MPVITNEFRVANYYEAALWFLIALTAGAFAVRRRGRVRGRCAVLAVTLIAFGFSDVVETRTGAWWRPWWLLAWKTVCVIALVALLVEHYWGRFRRHGESGGVPPPSVTR